jgi:tRNA A-37 threonylcarbamoyl transferase component Bud32
MDYVLGDLLSDQGCHSKVYEVKLDGCDELLIAKHITETYTYVEREINIATACSSLGIGPKIYKVHKIVSDQPEAIIIMKRYPLDLADYLLTNPSIQDLDKLMKALKTKLNMMHTNGFIHYDFTSDNIFCDTLSNELVEVVIGDYGSSFYDDDLCAFAGYRSDFNGMRDIEGVVRKMKKARTLGEIPPFLSSKLDLLKVLNRKCES